MVAHINDGFIFRNFCFPHHFYPKQGKWEEEKAPYLVEKGHRLSEWSEPNAQHKERIEDQETQKPPESSPNDVDSSGQFFG